MEEYAAFSVDSSFKAISSVCPTDEGTAWIALGWTADAHTFYRHGIKIKTHVVSKTIDFIARDTDNNLYMSSNEQKMVGKPGPGFNLDQFATFPGYHPRGLTITSNGDILICLAQSAAFQDYRPTHKNKVVRLDRTGKMTNEYGGDGKLFLYPLRIAVNVNDDICVSDSKKQSIVIIKSNGELKAEYNGKDSTVELKSVFEPRGIVCGSRGHIYVADSANHMIHMLDHLGNLQRLLLTEGDGLYGPYSVAIDKEDYMWVGCRDAAVKVYKMVWS